MSFEIGLYGQEERTAHLESAVIEQRADMEGEYKPLRRHIRCEMDFKHAMAKCVAKELQLSQHFRTLSTWTSRQDKDDPRSALAAFLHKNLVLADVDKDIKIRRCLQRMGRIVDIMIAGGWHLDRAYSAINCSLPMAIHFLQEQKLDARGTIQHADKPRSRIGRSAKIYRVPDGPISKINAKLLAKLKGGKK